MAASDDLLEQAAAIRADKPPALTEQSRPSDALLDNLATERKRRTDAVLDVVTKLNPDKAAETNRLSRQFGLDPETVQKSQDEFARLARIREAQTLMAASPFLARQMTDPAFAAIAQDDVKVLGDMERTLTGTAGDVVVTALKGAMGLPQAFVGLADIPTFGYAGKALDAIGLNFNEAQRIADSLYSPAQQAANKRVRNADGFVDTTITALQNPSVIATTIGESLPQMLGGVAVARRLLGLGAKTLGTGMVGPALPGLLARTVGTTYAPLVAGAAGEGIAGTGSAAEQIRSTTADGTLSVGQVAAAIASGVGTAGLSLLGGRIAKRLGIDDIDTALARGTLTEATIKKGLLRQLAGAGLSEGLLEELPQSAQEQVWQNIATDRPWDEGVGNAAAMGLLAGTGTGGVFQGVRYIAARGQEKAASADEAAKLIESLNKLASASTTLERNPAAVEQFIASATEDGPVQYLYINAQTLQQSGVAEQLAAISPSVAEQLPTALETGVEIRIPVGEYTSRIAPTEFAQGLVDDLRIDGEDFTRRQAQEYMQSGAAQELQEMVERAITKKQGDETFKASQDRVKAMVLEELNSLDRFSAQRNEMYAMLISARTAVRAAQLGMTPEQFFEKQRLKVAAEGVAGDAVLDQGEVRKTDQIDELTGLPLNEDGTVTVYHHTSAANAERIRKEGRIRSAGEPDLYFTTRAETDTGYGDTAIAVRVKPERLQLDDEFSDGRQDYRVESPNKARRLRFLPDGSAVLNQAVRDVTKLVEQARAQGNANATVVIGEVPEWEVAAAKAAGFDISGYRHTADIYAIRHAIKKHGDATREEKRNQIGLTDDDFKALPDALLNPDQVILGTKNARGQNQVFSIKRLSDGTLLVVEEIRTGKRVLAVESMRKIPGAKNAKELLPSVLLNVRDDAGNKPIVVTPPRGVNSGGETPNQPYTADTIEVDGKTRPAANSTGRPIATTEQGLRNFWRWFGDSKAVDAEGRPLVVYHGTRTKGDPIEAFDLEKTGTRTDTGYMGRGFYFSDARTANAYAGHYEFDPQHFPAGGAVYPVYLKIDKPLVLRDRVEDGRRIYLEVLAREALGIQETATSDEVRAAAIEQGYDGAVYSTTEGADAYREYVAFRPEQIKSPIGNSGAFDPANPNILMQSGEPVVRLKGNEVGEEITPLNAVAKARDYFKAYIKGEVVREGFGKVVISGRGWDKTKRGLPTDPVKVQLLPAIKAIIERGDYQGRQELDTPRRDGTVAFHFFRAPVEIGGKIINAGVSVGEDRHGNYYYNINKDPQLLLEKQKAQLELPRESLDSVEPSEGSDATLKQNIAPQADDINIDILKQGNDVNRGSFNPATNLMTLLNKADSTTFLHESMHYFFENDIALAAELLAKDPATLTAGEQQILSDVSAMLAYTGVKGDIQTQLAQWYSMDFEEKRAHHEVAAESFEAYLFSGKAPSIELQPYFQKFRAWLVSVYRSLKDFLARHPEAGKLDDTVRAVMDRMLATTEEIQLAEQGRSMMPLFQTAEQAGMTPEEFAAYQALDVDASNEAIQDLQARSLRDLAWTRNARSREIKRLQKQAAERRAEVRMGVRAEVMSQPIYRAWAFLTGKAGDKTDAQKAHDAAMADWNKERADFEQQTRDTLKAKLIADNPEIKGLKRGQLITKNKRQMDIDTQQALLVWDQTHPAPQAPAAPAQGETGAGFTFGRIDAPALDGMGIPEEITGFIKKLRMTAKEGGLHPDVVADMFGFASGDELVRSLAAAQRPSEEIEGLTDSRMLAEYGELATPEAIEREADKAIHNEARARMVATEANALAKATGKPKILSAAAREFARNMIARLKLRDIRPSQFANAEMRAAKAAEKASKAGDTETAATEKRNQLISTYATRAAYDAQDEVEKGLRYLRKFDGQVAGLDADYLAQIGALLDKFDLRRQSNTAADRTTSLRTWVQSRLNAGEIPNIAESLLTAEERAAYLAEVQSRDEDGELVYSEDEDAIRLLAEAIDRSAKRPYKDMTVEEFRGLIDTVENIEHLGRLKNRILTARDNQTYAAIRDAIAAGITDNASNAGKNTRTANSWLGQKLQAIRQFGASHIKAATWARIMDAGKDNGPVWRYLLQPANERASRETSMRAQATEALDAILRPILSKVSALDKIGSGRVFPGMGSLNWQERFAILLNVGNESNMQRLLGGGIAGNSSALTPAQITMVLRTFSAEELRAAQAIWDHFETYRPLIAAKEKRVSGKEPQWIPARAITIVSKDGETVQLRGGYFPVVYDPRVNLKASQHSAAEEAKSLLKASYSAATTRRSFVKSRVEEVTGRPLLLNLQGLYTGINDVIHDLAWHEWVIDANKLLRSTAIDTAIRDHYGPEVKREFEKWRDDIVAGSRRLDHAIERAAGWARQSVSASALTFNVLSAAMQPLGLANSISRIGVSWVGKGLARYVAAPIESMREAQSKSEWMANRTRTRFRELNELRNQVQGQTAARELMGRYGYWMMMRAQMMVDVPTWWAGYEKAVAEGHDERTAVNIADQAVKDSQGGGEEVDQSGIERGGPLVRLFTAFYGFMGTTLNTAVIAGKTESSKARAAAKILLVMIVPAVLGYLLKAGLVPGDDGDDDELAKKLITEQITFLFGLVAFGREFTQAAKALLGEAKGQGYSGPAGLRLIQDTVKLSQQAAQGEFDDAFRKAFVNVLGDLTGIPSVQINRTITGAQALNDGETDNPAAVVFGFQRPN